LRADKETRRVWGVVIRSLDPGTDGVISEADLERIDTYNTFFRHATVVAMAEQYIKHFRAMDQNHDYTPGVGAVVQSVVNDAEAAHGFPAWSWILGSEATPEELAKVERGEHRSYSMTTREERVPVTLTIQETGKQIDVEEVVNPICQYVSFVSRGANKSQIVIREDAEDAAMKRDKSVWQKTKDVITEALRTVAGERYDNPTGVMPEEPFEFDDKWEMAGKKSTYYSALYLWEDSVSSILRCNEPKKWQRIKRTTDGFLNALQPMVEALGSEALRSPAEAVTDGIDEQRADGPSTNDEVIPMTKDELQAIENMMKAAVEPLQTLMQELDKAKAEAKPEPTPETKPTPEPTPVVDELSKLRSEKADAEKQLAELRAKRETVSVSATRGPEHDRRSFARSVLRMTDRELAFAQSIGLSLPSEIDISGTFLKKDAFRDMLRASFTTADLALGGAMPQDVNKAFWVKGIAKQKLLPFVNTQFVSSNAKRVDILDFGSRKLRKGIEGISIGGTSKPTPSNVAIALQQATLDWLVSRESLNWNIEGGQLENTLLNGMSQVFGRDLEDLGSTGDTTSGTPFCTFDNGWVTTCAAGCHDVNGAPINAGVICEEHINEAIRNMPDQYQNIDDGTPLRFIMSSSNKIKWRKCVTDRGDLAGTLALLGDPKVDKPSNIPIVTPIAWPNSIILLCDPKALILAIGGQMEYVSDSAGLSLTSSGQIYYKLSQYVDYAVLDKDMIVRLYGMA
jgi:hypothetical protein